MRALCVSIHDVAPQTLSACQEIARAVERIDSGIPLTLLLVPYYHGDTSTPREYCAWIESRIVRSDELALHGLTHRDDVHAPEKWFERLERRVYTAGEGEFAALSRSEAAERLCRGRAWFAARNWPVKGFVAPAWLISRGTWDALRDSDFLYTTTLAGLHVLRNGLSVRAPSAVYSTRSAWRRLASRAWNAMLMRAVANMPIVRFGFHPADADYPEVMAHALGLLKRLAREREPITKATVAQRLLANTDRTRVTDAPARQSAPPILKL